MYQIQMTNVWLSQKGGKWLKDWWIPSKMFDLLNLIQKCIIQKMFRYNSAQHFKEVKTLALLLLQQNNHKTLIHLKHEQNHALYIINNISSAVVETRQKMILKLIWLLTTSEKHLVQAHVKLFLTMICHLSSSRYFFRYFNISGIKFDYSAFILNAENLNIKNLSVLS